MRYLGSAIHIVPRVENCGIVHRKRFTAENAEVAEEIVALNLCVLCGESFLCCAQYG